MRRRTWLALAAGAAVLCGTLRVVRAEQRADFRLITLPDNTPAESLSSVVDERTGAMLAARFLDLHDGGEALVDVLDEAYTRMDRALGAVPTPAITTYLGMQSADRFDAVVVEPKDPPASAVIFLHGYAGNFNVYCWHMANAIHDASTLVICPSVGPRGDFWTDQGLATVRATLDYLHDRNIQRVYLAGLSNGAVGAGTLAPKLEDQLAGLILISGAPRGARPVRLPVLLIQGSADQMTPARLARAYAKRSRRATYASFDGGHFIFLSRYEAVASAIQRWLASDSARSARFSQRTL